jgi:hypothetical protein
MPHISVSQMTTALDELAESPGAAAHSRNGAEQAADMLLKKHSLGGRRYSAGDVSSDNLQESACLGAASVGRPTHT